MRTRRYGLGDTRRVPSGTQGEERTIADRRSLRRARAGLVASALAILSSVAIVLPVAAAPAGAQAPAPRVVIIVGPSGASTDRYRAQAREAAVVARRFTADVTELYSPNATWPAVKHALQGASVVIYMGHGNGWPSPYRNSLYPPTQNGFGLNPTADGNDYQHQYFGEGIVGKQVHLAKDAVVLLNHLCYASGNSEPGVAEGTLDTAKLRVDNFAAGFIRAGASAVLADAYASPSGYLASILGGGRSIDSIWRRAPNANGNTIAFDSTRSPGYIDQMDPDKATSGFTRSIVLRAGLTPADVRAGAQGVGTGSGPVVPLPPPIPSLIKTPVRFDAPDIADRPSAGSHIRLDVPLKTPAGLDLLQGIQASIRWDVLGLLSPPTSGAVPGASPSPGPVPGYPGEVAPPQLTPLPPPESVDLVVAERPGDIVAPQAVDVRTTGLSLPVTAPAAPGTYRLTITLHDAEGVAFDNATQAMLPTLIVRVTGALDGAILAAPAMTLTAGSTVQIPVRIANLGTSYWGVAASIDPTGGTTGRPATYATIVGWWLPSGEHVATTSLPPAIAPGSTIDAMVSVVVPRDPGVHTLLLDLVTPGGQSLMAAGVGPTLIRVTSVTPR